VIVNTSNVNFVTTPTFTLPAGNNRYVLFMIADAADGSSAFPTSVTIAGTTATAINQTAVGGAETEAAQVWGAVIPDSTAAGDYTVVTVGSTFQRFFIAVFTGVSRDAVVDSDAYRNGSSDSDGDTLTVDCVGGGWVHDIIFATAAKTAGGYQNVVYNTTGRAGVSYKSELAHGTTSMAWTWTNSRSAHVVVSLRPYRSTGGAIIF